jgi:hypothetical protein
LTSAGILAVELLGDLTRPLGKIFVFIGEKQAPGGRQRFQKKGDAAGRRRGKTDASSTL